MKKLLVALIVGLVILPCTAVAQRWVTPQVRPDGTQEGGYWLTPHESWRQNFSKPGTINPMTGQYNTYGSDQYSHENPEVKPPPVNDIPGSSAPNPYAIPGSSVKPTAPKTK